MNKDKFRLIIIGILTFTVLLGAGLYGYIMFDQGDANWANVMILAVPFIIIVFMAFFVLRRYKDVKKGMPLEDERSKKVMTLAAARAFYVSLYWLLFISWFESLFAKLFGLDNLTASQTVGGGIAGMALLFFIFWIYYDRKGKLV
jgi:magnesium-transporting ATPase (P-type)